MYRQSSKRAGEQKKVKFAFTRDNLCSPARLHEFTIKDREEELTYPNVF